MRASLLLLPPALLLLGAACQAPFGDARQDLKGDRIVGVVAEPAADDAITVRAGVLVDGALYSDDGVALAWGWLPADAEDADALDPTDADATGRVVTLDLPSGEPVLGLVATFPSGQERRAILTLPGLPAVRPAPDGLTLRPVDLPLSDAKDDDLSADNRAAATPGDPVFPPTVAPGTWARLTPDSDDDTRSRLRWMGTAGSWLELDAQAADWASAELVLDGIEVDEATDLPTGPVSLVVLDVDDAGANTLLARELFVGPVPEAGVFLAGRWLPADGLTSDLPPGTAVQGRLALDDGPSGLRLVDAGPYAVDESDPDDPWGTVALGCDGPTDGPFDPSWLFDGTCTRAQLDGAFVAGEIAW